MTLYNLASPNLHVESSRRPEEHIHARRRQDFTVAEFAAEYQLVGI